MTTTTDTGTLPRRFAVAQRGSSLALVLIGALALVSRVLDLPGLTRFNPAPAPMKVNTGLLFLVIGAVLWRLGRPSGRTRWTGWAAGFVLLLAGITLVTTLLGVDIGLDNLFFTHPADGTLFPGRMSFLTSVGFTALAGGTLGEIHGRSRWRVLVQRLMLVPLLIGLSGMLGYLYRSRILLQVHAGYGSIALFTAVGFVLAAQAVILLRPTGDVAVVLTSDTSSGQAARRLIYAGLPLLLVLIMLGVEAEQAGLYDATDAAAVRTLVLIAALLFTGWCAFRDVGVAQAQTERALVTVTVAHDALENDVRERTAGLAVVTASAVAARAQIEAILHSTTETMAAVDCDGNFVAMNRAYVQAMNDIYGVVPKIGSPLAGVATSDPERSAAHQSRWARALRGEVYSYQIQSVDLHQAARVFDASYSPMRDPAGAVIGAVQVAREVTEHHRIQEDLRDREAKLDLTLDNAEVGLWNWWIATGIMQLDDNWNRIHGLTPAEAPADLEGWTRLVHPEDVVRVQAEAARHLADPNTQFDVTYRAQYALGEWIWVRSRGRVVERDSSGTPVRMMGTISDTTERKQTEAITARLAAVVEYAEDAVISTNPSGIVQAWNPGAERLFGFPAEVMVGRPMNDIVPTDRQAEDRSIRDRVLSGSHISGMESLRRHREGHLIQVSISAAPIYDLDGQVIANQQGVP